MIREFESIHSVQPKVGGKEEKIEDRSVDLPVLQFLCREHKKGENKLQEKLHRKCPQGAVDRIFIRIIRKDTRDRIADLKGQICLEVGGGGLHVGTERLAAGKKI